MLSQSIHTKKSNIYIPQNTDIKSKLQGFLWSVVKSYSHTGFDPITTKDDYHLMLCKLEGQNNKNSIDRAQISDPSSLEGWSGENVLWFMTCTHYIASTGVIMLKENLPQIRTDRGPGANSLR